jgi:DNA-binding NtrC family response regulator
MKLKKLLDGKRILAVDDEPDILEVIEELLPTCHIVKATRFEEARKLLETRVFDIAILDIMGVDGYQLLQIANEKNVISVMLTANALSPDNIIKSYKEGAASFLPKEKIVKLHTFLSDILEAKKEGRDPWWRWLQRLASFWKTEFGVGWQEYDKEFWDRLKNL